MSLPAANYLSNAARTEGEQKVAFEDQRDAIAQVPGVGVAEQSLTIASGSITPADGAAGIIKIDTEGGAGTDDLTNVAQTNVPDGSLLWLRITNNAHVVTVKHNSGGTGQITLRNGLDFVLSDTSFWLLVKRTGSLFEELAHFPVDLADTAQDFRMTLTSGTPVTTADVTAATTLYVTPMVGNRIALYSGLYWKVRTSAQMSIAVPSTTNTMYDLFCYDNAGVPTLEALAWTNDTTRATALAYQDGVLVKSGATTRRYLGSFRTTGVSGQTEDSLAKRYVWNYYHRRVRPMRAQEATDTWSYNTATIRQANASAANQLDYVQGVAEDAVEARIQANFVQSNAGNYSVVGVGVDSTTSFSGFYGRLDGAGAVVQIHAQYKGFPGVGRHVLSWNEWGSASVGTITWRGDNGEPTITQSGIYGEICG